MMSTESNSDDLSENSDDVFVVTIGGPPAPNDVVRARVISPPQYNVLYAYVFCEHGKLEDVELGEGLRVIHESAFEECISLKNIHISSTVTQIYDRAFYNTPLASLRLPDSVENIGEFAFLEGKFPTVRIPPHVTTIEKGTFAWCRSMFSLEIHENVKNIGYAFCMCRLRNVAIPKDAIVYNEPDEWVPTSRDFAFDSKDLKQLFITPEATVNALKCRFDNLPIHKMIYYQSYQPVTSDQLLAALWKLGAVRREKRSKLNPTGKQRDCLGMTPLHILACSTVQQLELYQVLIEKYPENLITEDEWGALPLLYAVLGDAPNDVLQFLATSYQSMYPDYEFNWAKMMEALVDGQRSVDMFESLLSLHEQYFAHQRIDWVSVLNYAAEAICFSSSKYAPPFARAFPFLVQYSSTTRVKAIGLKALRRDITDHITNYPHSLENVPYCNKGGNVGPKKKLLADIETKLVHNENEYLRLKEATSIIELVVWKNKMNDSEGEISSVTRKECRINCGADIVIEHMLPYLLPKVEVSTDSDQEQSTSDDDSEDESDSDSDANQSESENSFESDY